jgi:hypothetical protein
LPLSVSCVADQYPKVSVCRRYEELTPELREDILAREQIDE